MNLTLDSVLVNHIFNYLNFTQVVHPLRLVCKNWANAIEKHLCPHRLEFYSEKYSNNGFYEITNQSVVIETSKVFKLFEFYLSKNKNFLSYVSYFDISNLSSELFYSSSLWNYFGIKNSLTILVARNMTKNLLRALNSIKLDILQIFQVIDVTDSENYSDTLVVKHCKKTRLQEISKQLQSLTCASVISLDSLFNDTFIQTEIQFLEVVKQVYYHDILPCTVTLNGTSLLCVAIKRKYYTAIEDLLTFYHCNVNEVIIHSKTKSVIAPILVAIETGEIKLVQLLVDKGASLKSEFLQEGNIHILPMKHALLSNSSDMISFIANQNDFNPLEFIELVCSSTRQLSVQCVDTVLLILKKYNINLLEKYPSLHKFCAQPCLLSKITKLGADWKAVDEQENTFLHYAILKFPHLLDQILSNISSESNVNIQALLFKKNRNSKTGIELLFTHIFRVKNINNSNNVVSELARFDKLFNIFKVQTNFCVSDLIHVFSTMLSVSIFSNMDSRNVIMYRFVTLPSYIKSLILMHTMRSSPSVAQQLKTCVNELGEPWLLSYLVNNFSVDDFSIYVIRGVPFPDPWFAKLFEKFVSSIGYFKNNQEAMVTLHQLWKRGYNLKIEFEDSKMTAKDYISKKECRAYQLVTKKQKAQVFQFQCKQCGKAYGKQEQLKQHMQGRHKN